MDKVKIDKLKNLIESSTNILILPHESPDGDCIGSACGLGLVLKEKGKNVVVYEPDNIFQLLLDNVFGLDLIVQKLNNFSYDLIICVDISNIETLNPISFPKVIQNSIVPIVNIDHHRTNTNFGTLNIVDENSSAEGELLTKIIEEMGFYIPINAAQNFLLGIIFDTQNFKVPGTTSQTLLTAGKLIQIGADITNAIKAYMDPITIDQGNIFSNLIRDIKHTEDKKIAWLKIPATNKDEQNNILDFSSALYKAKAYLNSLKEVEIGIIFREEILKKNSNIIKISLRSKNLDISPIAKRFKGGGHKNASGCIIENKSIEDAEYIIVNECKEIFDYK